MRDLIELIPPLGSEGGDITLATYAVVTDVDLRIQANPQHINWANVYDGYYPDDEDDDTE